MRLEINMLINANISTVWTIVSDIDSEPKYWKGTKSVHNISREENSVRREITIAFRDQKCIQNVSLYPKTRIEFEFIQGIISGTKSIHLESRDQATATKVVWDIKLKGTMRMFGGIISGHIKKGTIKALESIRQEAESQ